MKKILHLLVLIPLLFLGGCDQFDWDWNHDHHDDNDHNSSNKVLMLRVDYSTNTFEGGIEYSYNQPTDSFNIDVDYVDPGDFGSILLTYRELQDTLFYGTIIWMGCGEMIYPTTIDSANHFDVVLTDDVVYPVNGFENIMYPNTTADYSHIWMRVQSLVKVRQYLQSNPNQKVKLFLYTPSVGMGNPLDWDWIIFVKN
jgi:hypothetical protein